MPRIGNQRLQRSTQRKLNKKIKSLNCIYRKTITHSNCQPTVQSSNCEVKPVETIAQSSELLNFQINPWGSESTFYTPNLNIHGIKNQDIVQCTVLPRPFSFADFDNQLRAWAIKNNIKQPAINSLLYLLRQHDSFKDLPVDSRTFLKTPRHIPVKEVYPGKYCHFKLETNLSRLISSSAKKVSEAQLQLNIDGLPISRSSSQQFWPILCYIVNLPESSPFPLGIYFGEEKPQSSNELLKTAVQEILQCDTIFIEELQIQVNVRLHSVVCDSPARAFVLNCKGHTGYFGCHKCTTEGEYYERRMTFCDLDCEKRTDKNIRERRYEDFNFEPDSEFCKLPVDLVKQFPLDYQHLVCLGTVRKLLYLWTSGKVSKFRLSARQTLELSRKLIECKQFFPSEFARKPRSLKHLNNWKATEFRTFLLYTGPVILADFLPESYYIHFLCLHVAITILLNENLQKNLLNYARELLIHFVKYFSTLYGQENVNYNVHNLIHLCDDSEEFGPLDTFSTFKFENYLGKLKRLLRSGNRPLEQIYNRVQEESLSLSSSTNNILSEPEFKISISKGNNACILKCGAPFLVNEIHKQKGSFQLTGHKLFGENNLYSKPCDSSKVGIKCYSLISPQLTVESSCVQCKAVVINLSGKYSVIPLRHQLT